MKVGIITFHNVINYGANLQAFALQESLKELGVDAQIINYTPESVFAEYKPFSLFRYIRTLKNNPLLLVRAIVSDAKHYKRLLHRNQVFLQFQETYYHYSGEACSTFEELRRKLPVYDVCFTGSDQVWNPEITYGYDGAYFLECCGEKTVKASYAASLGKEYFSNEEKEQLRQHLAGIDFISVREKTAAQIIEPLIEKKVHETLDPTLLISAEKWSQILRLQSSDSNGYIFVYTLYPNKELDTFVEMISEAKNLPVKSFNRRHSYKNLSETYIDESPEKFVELMAGASYVITNSFHGTAFAVNFSKPFVTFVGKSRSSRITEFLGMIGIPERAVSKYEEKLLTLPEIDYAQVHKRLFVEREKSVAYIKKVLESAEEK